MNRRGSIAAAEHLDGTVTSNQQDKITSVDCGQLGQPRRGNGKTSPSWATRPVDYTEVRTRLVLVPPGPVNTTVPNLFWLPGTRYYYCFIISGYPVPGIIIVPNLFLVTRYPVFFPGTRYYYLLLLLINLQAIIIIRVRNAPSSKVAPCLSRSSNLRPF